MYTEFSIIIEIFRCTLVYYVFFFFLMERRPPRSTQSRSSAASDVYKRQFVVEQNAGTREQVVGLAVVYRDPVPVYFRHTVGLSLIHISEPTRPY